MKLSRTVFFPCRCLSACVFITRTLTATPLFNVSFQLISSLTSAQCDSQSPIKYHLERCAFPFFFYFTFSTVLVLNGGRGEEEGKKMERSWVMDALCVSVIPNYWTLPFKAPLRCISHFCLSDWWRAGSDWGHCVLKHCLSSHSQFTSDTERDCSTAAAASLIYIQPRVPVIKCVVPTCSGLLCGDAKTNEIRNRIYLKEKTEGNTLMLSTACKQYKWPLFPRNASTVRLVTTEVWLVFISGCPTMHILKYALPLLAWGGAASQMKRAQLHSFTPRAERTTVTDTDTNIVNV